MTSENYIKCKFLFFLTVKCKFHFLQLKFYWGIATPICVYLFHSSFCFTVMRLNSYNRQYGPQSLKYLYLALYTKCPDSWFTLLEKQSERSERISGKMGQVQQILLPCLVTLDKSHILVCFLNYEMRILDLKVKVLHATLWCLCNMNSLDSTFIG